MLGLYECIDGDLPEIRDKKSKYLPLFEEAVSDYFGRNFEAAAKKFETILTHLPNDKVSHIYLKKCLQHMEQDFLIRLILPAPCGL